MTHRQHAHTSFFKKSIASLVIFSQAAFPSAIAFTPLIAHANTRASALSNNAEQLPQRTTTYTLSAGETTASVSKKFNLAIAALRALNQFRTFARGFDNLQPGDEIDVPLAPLAPASGKKQSTEQENPEKTFAGVASRVGAFFADHPDSDTMASMAGSYLSGAVNDQIKKWLARGGTARVQLDFNKTSGVKNSQFDLLLPLTEQKDSLFFTQQSLHRTDDRTQYNAGLGYRAFQESWMLGGNLFIDYDLSRGHMRLGTGLEYWRDYLKFGANNYLRLTNWQNSPDLEDYEERPANGWDIRAQGWLPAWPQLGAEVVYEQYYGKQVALFGMENRQNNPRAITISANYTPFPLLTLSAGHRQGQGGHSDAQFGLRVNYQPGVSWQKQTDPSAVSQMRKLSGNRYDLVARNNNIVLDYRKKALIRLQLAALVAGYAGQEKSLGVAVNSKYGLERIIWSAGALVAAGGKITQQGESDFSVVLPEYHSAPGGVNSYTVSAVAVDKKGNRSEQAQTQVTVTQAAISTSMSALTPAKSVLPADGKTQLQLLLKVNDREGKPVDINADEISVEKGARLRGTLTSTLSTFSRQAAGEYLATLTAGNKPESLIITPQARNSRFASASVTLTADGRSAQIASGELVVVKNNAQADGKESNSVKATVRDATGNLLRDQTVSFKADNGALIAAEGKTGSDGSVTVSLTNTTSGKTTVTASINGSSQRQVVNFVGDRSSAQIMNGDLVAERDNAKADSHDTNRVKATVKDANGNVLSAMQVNFSADNGAVIAPAGTTDAKGEVIMTLTSVKAGQSTVTASINGSRQHLKVNFVADNSTAQIISGALVVVQDHAKADGSATDSVKATVTDANGNRVPGQVVSFSADNGATIVAQGTTDDKGETTVTLTSTKAGQITVTASINGSSQRQAVNFVADNSTSQIASGDLVVVKDNAKASGSDTNSVKATVTDAHGNVLAGQQVSFSADNGAVIAASGTTDASGEVTMMLTSTKAGQSNVTASINGSSQRQTVTFIADSATAQIIGGNLKVVTDNAKADGRATNRVKATVTDAHGNLVPGIEVSFTADNGATIAAKGTTDAQGDVTVSLTSIQAGQSRVTASINGSSQRQNVTFIPDNSTAQIVSGNLTVVRDNAKANSVDINSVQATVTDAFGNIIPGMTVNFSADNGATIASSATTDAQGEASVSLTSTKAGQSTVTASINGSSQRQNVTFVADNNTAQVAIGALVVVTDNALANGKATNSVKVTVTDAYSNAVAGETVSFKADNGATIAASGTTDSLGEVVMTLTSTKAGQSKVSVTVNGGTRSQTVSFMADNSTAQIASGDLQVVNDNAKADGQATNGVKATVTDAFGNILAGQTVSFSADNGATITAGGKTDANGEITATLTSIKAGQSTVQATVNGQSQSKALTFIADSSTAQLLNGSLVIVADNALANGSATNSVKASVVDANGNAVPALAVAFSADNGATIAASGTTDARGEVTMQLTSTKAGQSKVVAKVNSSSQSQTLSFVADNSTAQIISSNLVVIADNALANGSATNSVKATVTDAYGNILAGQTVSFSADNSAKITASGTTDAKGEVTATLTSTKAGQSTVKATVNGQSQSKALTFVADNSTAQIVSGNLVVVADNALANGSATNSVKATVTDAFGNLVAGQMVSFRADNGATIATSATTDGKGEITVSLTSTKAGQSSVVATVNSSSQSQAVTFVADSSTAQIVSGSLVVVNDNALANGSATNSVKATVEDAYNNRVAGLAVSFSADNSAKIAGSATTDANGEVTTTITSTKAGQSSVVATVNSSSQSKAVTFIADSSTAQILSGNLLVVDNNAKADGSETNSVKATVTDAFGNLLSGQTVNFSADNGASITGSGKTGSDGSVTVTMTSNTQGQSTVTASVNGSSQNVSVYFVPTVIRTTVTKLTDQEVSDGTQANTFRVKLTDGINTPVVGFTPAIALASGEPVTFGKIAPTDSNGELTVSVKADSHGDRTIDVGIPGRPGSEEEVTMTFLNPPYTLTWANVGVDFSIPFEWNFSATTTDWKTSLRVSKVKTQYNGSGAATCPVSSEKPGTTVPAPTKNIRLTRLEMMFYANFGNGAGVDERFNMTPVNGSSDELYAGYSMYSRIPLELFLQNNQVNSGYAQSVIELALEDGTKVNADPHYLANFKINNRVLTEAVEGSTGFGAPKFDNSKGDYILNIIPLKEDSRFTVNATFDGSATLPTMSVSFAKGETGPCY
ncbi:Ig-like domain-containing protein [Vagococcus sp. WN89Y]|uniref:Ig-like domain-containing protein n=1 Tax=Vagococcus sp. WN89Y TaxID=3457258 RepID=UPI003FCDBD6A